MAFLGLKIEAHKVSAMINIRAVFLQTELAQLETTCTNTLS